MLTILMHVRCHWMKGAWTYCLTSECILEQGVKPSMFVGSNRYPDGQYKGHICICDDRSKNRTNLPWCICIYFDPDCSTVMKQDLRCQHTYVYIVHKGHSWTLFCRQFISKIHQYKSGKGHFLNALPAGSTTFEHFCDERQTWIWDLLKCLV